jgi:hypothetical protein
MEGEVNFHNEILVPEDISNELYDKFKEFFDENQKNFNSYFCELLSFKRCAFSLEIAAPIKVIHEIDKFLKQNGYITYNDINFVEKGDENMDVFPQDLFEKYPNEVMGATSLYISYRHEFVHLAKIVENVPLECDQHEQCDPRAALKGLLYGYSIPNIINFIDQDD